MGGLEEHNFMDKFTAVKNTVGKQMIGSVGYVMLYFPLYKHQAKDTKMGCSRTYLLSCAS